MEPQYVLSEAQWALLAPLLPGRWGPGSQDDSGAGWAARREGLLAALPGGTRLIYLSLHR